MDFNGKSAAGPLCPVGSELGCSQRHLVWAPLPCFMMSGRFRGML